MHSIRRHSAHWAPGIFGWTVHEHMAIQMPEPYVRANFAETIVAMSSQPESSAQEVLAGLVERVTFHNAENGFCVLRAKARGHRELVTVVGHAATIAAGEWIT